MTAAGKRAVKAADADAVMLRPFIIDDIEVILRQFLGEPPTTPGG